MYKRILLGCAVFVMGSVATARDVDRWMRLGQRDLDPRGETADIAISRHPRLEALVLGVDNAAIRIVEARILLDNGKVVTWPIRGVLYPGQRTHVFDLPGRLERRIRRVVVYYETGHVGRRPRGARFRELDRNLDRGPYAGRDPEREWMPQPGGEARDWSRDFDRNWERDWDRSYGRLKPRVSVWGRD